MNLGHDERDPTGRFVRGLTMGALLGAVIAGSSIWTKARARRTKSAVVVAVELDSSIPQGPTREAAPAGRHDPD